MDLKPVVRCHHCNAKMVEYAFTFNKGLVSCLKKIYPFTEPVEIRTLGMTTSQWTNFQKLRYWNFIEPWIPLDNDQKRKGGWWQITPAGVLFVEGKISVFKRVWMYRNHFARWDGEQIYFKDVNDGYEYRPDYAQKARPRSEEDQLDFF